MSKSTKAENLASRILTRLDLNGIGKNETRHMPRRIFEALLIQRCKPQPTTKGGRQ